MKCESLKPSVNFVFCKSCSVALDLSQLSLSAVTAAVRNHDLKTQTTFIRLNIFVSQMHKMYDRQFPQMTVNSIYTYMQ